MTDSVTCGQVVSINAAALTAARATCIPGDPRSVGPPRRIDEPRVMHYFDLRDEYRRFELYRPSAARRIAWESSRLGAYEGAWVFCLAGLFGGAIVGLVARPSVGEGAGWGCAVGGVAGVIIGAESTYRDEYNGGWVQLKRRRQE